MQELDYSLAIGSIIGILGVGGFGITYKAQDEKMQRLVAFKEFLEEARTLAKFNHPNIAIKFLRKKRFRGVRARIPQ